MMDGLDSKVKRIQRVENGPLQLLKVKKTETAVLYCHRTSFCCFMCFILTGLSSFQYQPFF